MGGARRLVLDSILAQSDNILEVVGLGCARLIRVLCTTLTRRVTTDEKGTLHIRAEVDIDRLSLGCSLAAKVRCSRMEVDHVSWSEVHVLHIRVVVVVVVAVVLV